MNAPVKVYTKKALIKLYGVSRPVFLRWIKDINTIDFAEYKRSHLVKPGTVAIIFAELGTPEIPAIVNNRK